jgi:hypothetical protein
MLILHLFSVFLGQSCSKIQNSGGKKNSLNVIFSGVVGEFCFEL